MTTKTEVPSPFCGIGTDDLVLNVDGKSINVLANGCAINTPAFEQAIGDMVPRVNGEEVALEVAVAQAADILKASNQTLIGGCATDVNGMRALVSLADHNGAVVDNVAFNTTRRNILALQDSGWMTTTLAEVKNRCDLLVVIGTDIEKVSPRFFEHFIWNESPMFLEASTQCQVVYLGKEPSGQSAVSPVGVRPQVLPCADEDLPEVVAVLRALVKGNNISHYEVDGLALTDLQALAKQLKEAAYGVVTWSAGSLDFPHAELTVQVICELVKDLNEKTRCSGLPLGGSDGDQTANQVTAWLTGYPARLSFAKGFPEYDPYLYDGQLLLENKEVDALLWVHDFNSKALPPEGVVPTIVIGRSGMCFEKEPAVFIPVGTPGIDHCGHAFRMDGVVAIRLQKLRESGLPSTAEVLTLIDQAL
jgi:formylmethanofuran dehydrogenase subunit B